LPRSALFEAELFGIDRFDHTDGEKALGGKPADCASQLATEVARQRINEAIYRIVNYPIIQKVLLASRLDCTPSPAIWLVSNLIADWLPLLIA